MPPTSISSASPYASAYDLMNYVHPAQLGDWCSNDGTRVSVGSIPGNTVIQAALSAASGEFESAVIRGGRYKPSDFAALTGNDLQQVVRIVCNLAKYVLWARMARKSADDQIPPGCKEAAQEIDRLGRGEHVFAFLETYEAAGVEAVSNDGLPIPPVPIIPLPVRAAGYFGNRLGYNGWDLPGG